MEGNLWYIKSSASVCASYSLILDIFSKFRPWLMKCSKKNFVLYNRFEFKQKSCSRLYPMSQYLNNVSITNTSVSSIALLTITPLKSKIPLSLYAIVQKSHKTFFNYNYIKHSNWGLLKKKTSWTVQYLKFCWDILLAPLIFLKSCWSCCCLLLLQCTVVAVDVHWCFLGWGLRIKA